MISMTLPMIKGTDMVTAEETVKSPTAVVIAVISGFTRFKRRHVSAFKNFRFLPEEEASSEEGVEEEAGETSMGTEPPCGIPLLRRSC